MQQKEGTKYRRPGPEDGHLNIAKVLDAGTTEAGRPYFAMELVHGVSITEYCDDNRLTTRERLELFVPVCQAIQHAHQKGIIHRDIKPRNILVTLYDGKPVPKVIDFGLAKALEQRLTDRTLFTQFGAAVGTFEYMAPEQAEMSALGVDTRSDIYSLGVLLYELLTGATPLDRKKLREAAFTDMIRMIKEVEPPRPSAQLSGSGTLPVLAAARKTEPAKLTKLVKGELDWIVMKCLDKDRTRRYETANGLARDIQRYLADEPVEACPPSASYRLRRFARKHKKGLAIAAAFVSLLVVGVAVSIWEAVRATQAEQRERHVALRMQQERDRAQLALTRQMAKRLEGDLQRLARVGDALAATVANSPKVEEGDFVGWMREVLKKEESIFGLTLGFEPGKFQGRPTYCLYVCRGGPEGIETKPLHENADYKYREMDWYVMPRHERRDLWGEPYFDNGGADRWIVSYSMRLFRKGEFVGVLTVDLPIEDYSRRLQGWLDELIPGEKSYGFVTSRTGVFISHPKYKAPEKILALKSVEEGFATLTRRMLEQERGRQTALDPSTGRRTTFLYIPVQPAGWSLVVAVEETADPPSPAE